jgi:hypothetical protein
MSVGPHELPYQPALMDDDHSAPTVLAGALAAAEPRIGPYRISDRA